jgi:2,4-diaminopentanoate dehydrogenase
VPIRVALYGFGNVGRQAAALLWSRSGVEVVAVIGRSTAGRPARAYVADLPDGLLIEHDAERTLERTRPDVVVHATVPSLDEALPQILTAVRHRCHVVSSCEELAYPWHAHREQAERLEAQARQHGVAVLGTGVNPGYVFDALVLNAMSPRWSPSRIEVSRVTDASSFGAAVRGRLGLGLAPDDFRSLTTDGRIAGHVGFRESMDLCAAALGTQLTSFREWFEPIIAGRDAQGLAPGLTAGFEQRAAGQAGLGPAFDFRIVVHLWPGAIGIDVADTIKVHDGDRVHEMQLRPACPPVQTAAAQLVNALPHLVVGEPGLRTALDLRGPLPWLDWPKSVGWRHSTARA